MDGLAVELRKQQNVAREGGKPARIEEDLVDVLRLLLGGLLVLLQKRGVALDRADGRFELVRDVRDEVGLQGLGRVQLADHEVEAVKAVADIAKDALRLHMHAEVAARDLLHRARQARDGREERDGKARRRRAAEQQREDEQPHEHRHVDAEVLKSQAASAASSATPIKPAMQMKKNCTRISKNLLRRFFMCAPPYIPRRAS